MAAVLTPLYCCQCKKIMNSLSDLIFVDNEKKSKFCSSQCVGDYYSFLGDYYRDLESQLRSSDEFKNDLAESYSHNNFYLKETLKNPLKILKIKSEIQETHYVFLSEYESADKTLLYSIVIAFIFESEISAVLFNTLTSFKRLTHYFEEGEEIQLTALNLIDREQLEKDRREREEKDFERLEYLKSTILAKILSRRDENDISFESFHDYGLSLRPTLEKPDEIISSRSPSGDRLFTYIRFFQNEKGTYYYFVICLNTEESWNETEDPLLPIFAFPSCQLENYIQLLSEN